MKCAQKVSIPRCPDSFYQALIDIDLVKYSCFVRKHNVQVQFVDTERGNAFKPDKQASFIIVYNALHAAVLSAQSDGTWLAYDSVQFSELTQYLSRSFKESLPIKFADWDGFVHPAVQLDLTSCLAISVVYIQLRAGEQLDHSAAVRKLTSLRYYQIREYCFRLLGLLQNTPQL